MTEIKMNKFGISLTGRPFGKDCFEKINREGISHPIYLNFSGVITLGSSFGEEILVPISQNGKNEIFALNANSAVKDCIQKIVEDFSIKISFNN